MLPERKHIRLKDYDYSAEGYYFVTICTDCKRNILGQIAPRHSRTVNEETRRGRTVCDPQSANTDDPWGYSVDMPYTNLSAYGKIILENFKYINENLQVIMPNHVHFIVQIIRGAHRAPPTLAGIVRTLKRPLPNKRTSRFGSAIITNILSVTNKIC